MAKIQGIDIGLTMACFLLALLTVNTLTAGTGIGIELDAAGTSESDVESVVGEFNHTEVTGVGNEDPGFFGIAVGVADTINQLYVLTTGLKDTLRSWGVPSVIAYSVQIIVDFVIAVGILQILLRFKF